MLWNCGGDRTPEAWRNSSSVRILERERFICAASGIVSFEAIDGMAWFDVGFEGRER
jgi:hypothetical protein